MTADSKRSRGSFVNYGYSECHYIKEKDSCHTGNRYHQQAVHEAYGIMEKFENPTNKVKTIIDENLKQEYQMYPKVVEALA